MINSWSHYNPVEINFGRGIRKLLRKETAGRACLVVSSKRGRHRMEQDAILAEWLKGTPVYWHDCVENYPSLEHLQQEIDRLRGITFELIIAFGGGSAIDTAKILSIALPENMPRSSLIEIMEKPIDSMKSSPYQVIAFPTTAGTGSEVTPFATVWDCIRRKKYSLSGSNIYVQTAFIDPDLTDSLSTDMTMYTGLDAINQAVESIWNKNATPITIELAIQALVLGMHALPKLIFEKGGTSERDKMAECSLLAGLAISQTRTSLCHSISYPLTLYFGIPHGLACAFTMPSVLKLNLDEEDGRFKSLTHRLLGKDAGVGALLDLFIEFNYRMEVGKLIRKRISAFDDLMKLAEEMYSPGRADNNLAIVNTDVIRNVLSESWESGRFRE